MTQPPADPDDEPLGGALSPATDEEPPEQSGQSPVPPAFPPPPPAAAGYPSPPGGNYPSSEVPEAFAAPQRPGSYPPPPPGSFPAAPDYPPAFPPGPDYAGAAMVRPHRGTVILVLGVLGLLLCAPLSFFAFFMARTDLAAMDAGTMNPSGRGGTNIGRILGLVGMVLFVVQMVYFLFNFDSLST